MEPEGSLLFSQEPTIGPYTEPDELSPHLPNLFLLRSFLISSHLHLGLPSGLFPSGFLTEIMNAFSSLPCVPHTTPITSSLSKFLSS